MRASGLKMIEDTGYCHVERKQEKKSSVFTGIIVMIIK